MDPAEHQHSIRTSDSATESSSLLAGFGETSGETNRALRTSARRGRLSTIFRWLRRGGTARIMREPSVLVRETAAEQLEERQSDWSYSRPVVVLDLIWNLAFITVALVVLLISRRERPQNPLRLWIVVYAVQCCIHMICVWVEYRRRHRSLVRQYGSESLLPNPARSTLEQSQSDVDLNQMLEQGQASNLRRDSFKRIESANTSFSFLWWVIGFYWTSTGSQSYDAPLLFWLCVAFLAFDVFFVVFCVSLACIIGVAVCCCLPCIIAFMHAVTEPEGASEEDLNLLPRYKFRQTEIYQQEEGEMAIPSGGVMTIIGNRPPGANIERVLPAEDAECCICLSSYEDDVELRELPCSHHFHSVCVDRWLRMHSTCPLCKYNVCKNANDSGADDV